MSQREMMRRLQVRLRGVKNSIVAAYASAEARGEVFRTKNKRGMSREDYAEKLYADGIRKGWINTQ